MMVLCIRDILDWQKKHPKFKYTLRVSYLEVYNEEINDLLGEPGMIMRMIMMIVVVMKLLLYIIISIFYI